MNFAEMTIAQIWARAAHDHAFKTAFKAWLIEFKQEVTNGSGTIH